MTNEEYMRKLADMQTDISAYKQKPSGDTISREAVLDYIHRILNQGTGKKKSFEFIRKYVEKLPPVKPQKSRTELKYCDRNICMANEYNGIGCDECEVTKSQEPTDENLHREREQAYMQGYEDASKRFRQEPCKDAISRKIITAFLSGLISNDTERKKALQYVNELPSVAPQPKTGHWIYKYLKGQFCSICDEPSICKFNYCPSCDAKMVELQESEDKE